MTDRTVSVTLRARVDNWIAGHRQAAAQLRQFSQELRKAAREQGLYNEASRKLARQASGIGAVALTASFVKAASDLVESQSKTQQVFGQSSDAINAWAQNSSKALLMSKRDALEAASTFGNLFTAMGFGQGQAAAMSEQLVQLAADLASFNNTSPAEALAAIRSGLAGEIEPLRRYGVNLTQATLQQEALAEGLIKTKQQLTPAQQAQAAYNLILKQTKTAQGDVARTSGNLADSARSLSAQWGDAQAKLGQDLLPAAIAATHGLSAMLDTVNGLPGPVRDTGLAAAGLGTAFVLALPRIQATREALDAMGITTDRLPRKIAGAAGKFALISTAAVIAGKAISSFGDNTVNGGATLDTLISKLGDTGKGVDDFGYKIRGITQGEHSLNEAIATVANPSAFDNFDNFVGTLFGVSTGLGQASEATKQVDQALAALATTNLPAAKQRFDELKKSFIESGGKAEDFDRVMVNAQTAIYGTTTQVKTQATTIKNLADAWHDASGQAKTFDQALRDLNGPAIDAAQAELDLIDASKALAESLRKGGRSFDEHTAAGRANLSLLLQEVQSIEAYASAVEASAAKDHSAAYAKNAGIAALESQKQSLIDNMVQLGMTRSAAQKLIDKYLQVPPHVKTKAELDTAAAKAKAADLTRKVQAIPNVKRQIVLDTAAANAAADALAAKVARIGQVKLDNILGGGDRSGQVIPSTPGAGIPNPLAKARGGWVWGAGTATSDSIPARLSRGEFVVNAAAAAMYGPDLEDMNAMRFADGGPVDIGFGDKTSKGKGHKRRHSGRRTAKRTTRSGPGYDTSVADQLAQSADLIGSFDFSQHATAVQSVADATQALADAQASVVDAQRAVNAASTPKEQADAAKQLADARAAAAKATTDLAKAQVTERHSRPTAANIVAGFKGRAAKLARLRRNIGILAARGLSPVIIREILDSGIDTGDEMAAALVAGGAKAIGDLNATQASITADSTALAKRYASTSKTAAASTGSSSSASTGTAGSSAAVAQTVVAVKASDVILHVSNREVARAMLEFAKVTPFTPQQLFGKG